MSRMTVALLLVASSVSVPAWSDTGAGCPATLGTDGVLGRPFPESGYWHGTEALAVSLPADGVLSVTGPGARIAAKLFWRSAGYRPGMEGKLKIHITDFDGRPSDAIVRDITNANSVPDDLAAAQLDDDWMDNWAMLTGVDFPTPGCWRVTGEYLGQSLSFVVETIENPASQRTSE